LRNVETFAVGVVVGFLGGLFGKGGSAIATPLLSLIGIPGFVAVASPLPATLPGTLVASAEYRHANLLDWRIVLWSIGVGVPATVLGSLLTALTGARPLLFATGVLVLIFGLSFLLPSKDGAISKATGAEVLKQPHPYSRVGLILVATGAGLISGLLANSGGFLLAPSYVQFLRQPIKRAFACSLAVSAALSVPGTIVHAWLGHISWPVAGFVALGSVPASYFGARLAIRTRTSRLQRWYGIALTALGVLFLFHV